MFSGLFLLSKNGHNGHKSELQKYIFFKLRDKVVYDRGASELSKSAKKFYAACALKKVIEL